jgi:hypothetical protein
MRSEPQEVIELGALFPPLNDILRCLLPEIAVEPVLPHAAHQIQVQNYY